MIVTWFVISVLAEIVSTVALRAWLASRGVEARWARSGIPGYLEGRFADWARTHQRRPAPLIVLRIAILMSAIISTAFFIPWVLIS